MLFWVNAVLVVFLAAVSCRSDLDVTDCYRHNYVLRMPSWKQCVYDIIDRKTGCFDKGNVRATEACIGDLWARLQAPGHCLSLVSQLASKSHDDHRFLQKIFCPDFVNFQRKCEILKSYF